MKDTASSSTFKSELTTTSLVLGPRPLLTRPSFSRHMRGVGNGHSALSQTVSFMPKPACSAAAAVVCFAVSVRRIRQIATRTRTAIGSLVIKQWTWELIAETQKILIKKTTRRKKRFGYLVGKTLKATLRILQQLRRLTQLQPIRGSASGVRWSTAVKRWCARRVKPVKTLIRRKKEQFVQCVLLLMNREKENVSCVRLNFTCHWTVSRFLTQIKLFVTYSCTNVS